MSGPPGLAVALVTHNSERDLGRFLAGQLAAAEDLQAPVVVVDNASSDGTAELLRAAAREHPGLVIREMGRNAGYAAGVNAAFRQVPGRDVLLVNPDVELSSGEPVLALARVLERVRSAAVVAPRLLGDDGEVQPNARLFPSLAAMIGSTAPGQAIPLLRRRYERYVAPSYADHPRTVDWAIGAAMLIRRDAFDAVGGWDEGFFLYMEDTDFCRSCLRAGWDVVYVPDVSLHHRYPRASSTATSLATSRARRSHFAGMARLWRRDPRLMLGLGRGPARRIDVSGAER